jgi:hypothetical protein
MCLVYNYLNCHNAEAPQPPYKAAAPRPCSRQPRSRRLASRTIVAQGTAAAPRPPSPSPPRCFSVARAAAGVLPWGKGPHRPAFLLPLPFPLQRLLAVATVPRLIAIRLPRSLAPLSKPLNAFPSSLSFSQGKPKPKSWTKSRLHDSPMSPAADAIARLAAGV